MPDTCFTSIEPEIFVPSDGTYRPLLCRGDWNIILDRTGPFTNPGITSDDYLYGFEEDGFVWFGTYLLFSLTKTINFNLRIDMWDEDMHFYYADYVSFIVQDSSTLYALLLGSFADGSHGDGGLMSGDLPFYTSDALNGTCSTGTTKKHNLSNSFFVI